MFIFGVLNYNQTVISSEENFNLNAPRKLIYICKQPENVFANNLICEKYYNHRLSLLVMAHFPFLCRILFFMVSFDTLLQNSCLTG